MQKKIPTKTKSSLLQPERIEKQGNQRKIMKARTRRKQQQRETENKQRDKKI